MKIKNYTPLHLLAADGEDVQIVSACLQDAVMKIGDMAFLPKQRRFAFVANRFVWEEGVSKKKGPFTRVRCGVHFDDVFKVRARNIRQDAKSAVVSLLGAEFFSQEDGCGTIVLAFAGGGEVCLDVEGINVSVNDISVPWRTKSKPEHGVA